MKTKQKIIKKKVEVNEELVNLISPTEITFNRNDFNFGNKKARIVGIVKYPQTEKCGFLSKITNIPNSFVNIHYKPLSNQIITDAINKTNRIQTQKLTSEKDADSIKQASVSLDNIDKLLEMMLRGNEQMGYCNVQVMNISEDEKTGKIFENSNNKVLDTIASISATGRLIPNFQKELFKSINITDGMDTKTGEIYNKIMPISTFIGGFPFASTGFNDGQGYYFAKDVNGSLIILDLWKRGNDRTNSNMVITGKPGSGKSTMVKHLLYNEYGRGTVLLIIDPEREYIEEAHNMGGEVLNVVGGKHMINPLQILKSPKNIDKDTEEDDGENNEDNLDDLSKHLNTLEVFFKLYNTDITKLEMAELKKCLVETYNKKGINWDTDIEKLKNTDYPTLTDLYNIIEEKKKENPDNNNLKNLTTYIEDMVNGADRKLWNGYTNINYESRYIVFDTKDLQSASDNKKSAEYYLIMNYIWNIIEQDRTKRTLLCADESYLMIDVNVPQTLIFLRNISKRIRKYEGSLVLITHDVEDFLNPSIKQYGQSLLSTACYKVLFGTDGQNLQEEVKLFNLTEAERELLEAQNRQHALFIAGTKKLHANFEIDETELAYFGKAGGR